MSLEFDPPASSPSLPPGGQGDGNAVAPAAADAAVAADDPGADAGAAAHEPWDEDPFGAEEPDGDGGPPSPSAEAAAAANPEAVAAAAAAAALESARETARALERERELLSRQKEHDFGADGAWLALAGQCAETGGGAGGHFTYRLCFFDAAAQVDGAGHETSLGKWAGIERGAPEGEGAAAGGEGEGGQGRPGAAAGEAGVAVFSGGDWCQNGPARSLRARLVCGAEFRAWGASEPETCVYAATVSAPQACSQEGLAALERAAAALEAEQRRLAGQIAADEAARRQEAAAGEEEEQGAAPAAGHDEL